MIQRMLALPLLQDQLLQVLVGKDARVLYHEAVNRVWLLVVAPVLLVLQRLLGGDLVIYNFFLLLLALGRTGALVDACRHEGHLCLSRLAGESFIFLAVAHQPRVVLHEVLLLVSPVVPLGLVVKVVRSFLAPGDNDGGVVLGRGVEQLH